MKKILAFITMAAVIVSLTACSAEGKKVDRVLEPSAANYDSGLGTGTPEGLAQASSRIYMGLGDGTVSVEDAIKELKAYSSKDSVKELEKSGDFFKKQIEELRDYLKANDDKIVKFEFAKTVYEGTDSAYIERIQKQKNGKCYYFRQDFILEDGSWKICGDNIADPFSIKAGIKLSFFKN